MNFHSIHNRRETSRKICFSFAGKPISLWINQFIIFTPVANLIRFFFIFLMQTYSKDEPLFSSYSSYHQPEIINLCGGGAVWFDIILKKKLRKIYTAEQRLLNSHICDTVIWCFWNHIINSLNIIFPSFDVAAPFFIFNKSHGSF